MPRQQLAWQELQQLGIFENLSDYDPVLAGTIPLEIDIPESDLDILCEVADLAAFAERLSALYSHFPQYKTQQISIRGRESLIACFRGLHFEIEIFGQNLPVVRQDAYRHLLIEHQLLRKHGADFREQVIALKRSGQKTEPAFAQILGLDGDSYEALFALE